MADLNALFTIGCSTHEPAEFVALLHKFQINVVVDVRSAPFSRHTPHFNQKPLQTLLNEGGLSYLYMGREFGARRSEPGAYCNGQVDFERVFDLDAFQEGVQRIKEGLTKGFHIALMCTEKDPMDCHRTIMVTRYLSHCLSCSIQHIHFDGEMETNEAFEERLKQTCGVAADLFTQDEGELLRDAYNLRADRIAWRKESA